MWLHIQRTDVGRFLTVAVQAVDLQQKKEVNLFANCYDLGWYQHKEFVLS